MAELKHFDLAGSYLQALAGGRQMRAHDEQRQDRLTLRDLAAGAIGGDPDAQARAYAIDPNVGQSYQKAGDQRALQIRGMAKYVYAAAKSGDPAAAQAAHTAIRGDLSRLLGQPVPDQFDPATMMPNLEKVLATTEHLESGANGKPAQQQYAEWLLSQVPEGDREQALGVMAGTKARPSSALPFAPLEYEGPDGAPRVEVIDKRTGQATAPNAAGRPSAINLAGELRQFGAQITSGFRDPAKNGKVGGVANSQHMQGTAFDAVLPPQIKDQAIAYGRQNGYEVIDEGDHVHFELPPQASAYVGQRPGERKYEETAGGKSAEFDADQRRAEFDQGQAAAVEAAKSRAGVMGDAQGKAEAGLSGAVRKADQAIALIDQAIAHPGRAIATGLSSRLDPRNMIPGSDAYNFNVLARQIQGKAFLEAFESLKGAGAITDREGAAATEAMARMDRAQSDEEFVLAMQELQGILRQGQDLARQRAGKAAPASNAAPAGNGWGIRLKGQ